MVGVWKISRCVGSAALMAVLVLGTASCSRDRNREPDLVTFGASRTGPDEFNLLPTKPLQIPENLAALPEPVPGGANLTDPTPRSDAVAALGGRPGAGTGGADVVRYARRFGSSPTIRQELAVADYRYRQENRGRVLERLFNNTVYYQSYDPLSLDQEDELERFRRAGVRTPSAPPLGVE